MREDGFNAGWRRIGTLALWAIPLILGAAACVWLGFVMATHDWFHALSQEQRRAIYVGAENRPKSKLVIETPNLGCIIIDRVDLDGDTAAVYFHNSCQQQARYIKITWQLISPNETALGSGSSYSDVIGGPATLGPGEHGEAVFSGLLFGISTDNRAAKVRFTAE